MSKKTKELGFWSAIDKKLIFHTIFMKECQLCDAALKKIIFTGDLFQREWEEEKNSFIDSLYPLILNDRCAAKERSVWGSLFFPSWKDEDLFLEGRIKEFEKEFGIVNTKPLDEIKKEAKSLYLDIMFEIYGKPYVPEQ